MVERIAWERIATGGMPTGPGPPGDPGHLAQGMQPPSAGMVVPLKPDSAGFVQETEPFRRELLAHCYRMLGSVRHLLVAIWYSQVRTEDRPSNPP